jgi:hypothetical protein
MNPCNRAIEKITCRQDRRRGLCLGIPSSQKRGDQLKLIVLACAVMEREIRRFEHDGVLFKFLDYGLHRTPENMANALQTEIDHVSAREVDGVVLGYGLCSNGIVGIRARRHPLIVPRVHDCIALFLGSPEGYQDQSTRFPGTYYLTPGWIEKGETPLSKFNSYANVYGEETARWVIHEEMKHYTRIALIKTGEYPMNAYRKIAKQNAHFLGIQYQELKGSSRLFQNLVQGLWHRNYVIVETGQTIEQEMFVNL